MRDTGQVLQLLLVGVVARQTRLCVHCLRCKMFRMSAALLLKDLALIRARFVPLISV